MARFAQELGRARALAVAPALAVTLAVTFAVAPLAAQSAAPAAADSAAIRAAALDYVEGWYTGDSARMARALHPELAKRIVHTDPRTGRSQLDRMGAAALVEGAARGGGSRTPPERRRREVRLLDVYHNTASVRADMAEWIDYMHLARWNGRWVIVNVLWELRPEGEVASAAASRSR